MGPLSRLVAAAVVFVVAAAGVAALLVFGNADDVPDSRHAAAPSAPRRDVPEEPRAPVLAVKIDNVAEARPQAGLAAADVVYVEPVEGGLTRLVAVYSSRLPGRVGPVRSARESDVELLAQYGRPVLAYSGSAPEIRPLLRKAPLTAVTERSRPRAFTRSAARQSPHNLYLDPRAVPMGRGPAPERVLRTGGAAPPGGTPTTTERVDFRAASYRFDWSAAERRWRVSLGGSPLRSEGAGAVRVPTVVVQHVALRSGRGVSDATGASSPVARTTGDGRATVLRDGRRYEGTWSRPDAGAGTTFRTSEGDPLRPAAGPVWVLLVPNR